MKERFKTRAEEKEPKKDINRVVIFRSIKHLFGFEFVRCMFVHLEKILLAIPTPNHEFP